MRVEGCAAVVTGGSSGIGRAICLELVKNGARVVVADIDDNKGAETVRLIHKEYGFKKAIYKRCDVRKLEDIQGAINQCLHDFRRFDILCNNAGIGGNFGSFTHGTDLRANLEESRLLLSINMDAVIFGTQVAIAKMRELGTGGVIVNTASMGGILPIPLAPVYGATKAAVIHFTRCLEGLQAENIKVCAICPTYTQTALVSGHEDIMREQIGGELLTAETVGKAFVEIIEDETSAGCAMRVTRAGMDYWIPRSRSRALHSKL